LFFFFSFLFFQVIIFLLLTGCIYLLLQASGHNSTEMTPTAGTMGQWGTTGNSGSSNSEDKGGSDKTMMTKDNKMAKRRQTLMKT
jgi:hypothetical protein